MQCCQPKNLSFQSFVQVDKKKGDILDTLTRIRGVMKEKGITQRALTSSIGLKEDIFGAWKAGRSASYKKYLWQIAAFLDVSVGYLLGETEDRHPPAPPGQQHAAARSNSVTNAGEATWQSLSDEEKEILRVYKSLPVRDRHKLMGLIYEFEEKR
jgi:transcriptional regulator with XRE-family HTH domain